MRSRFSRFPVVAALALAAFGLSASPVAAASGPHGSQATPSLDAAPSSSGSGSGQGMAVLGASAASGPAQAAEEAAAARARSTGRAVQVGALTTATSTVWVNPDGVRVLHESVLPVRVRERGGWVPVDTRLRHVTGGMLAPVAVPGDTVTLSDGGTGAMATLSADGARLALSWPGRLPVPVIAGSSATYRNVLPGVDLVLTATSTVSGGFREVLVVRNAAAAASPSLADLALRVSASGTWLAPAPGGGFTARLPAGAGEFVVPPVRMWDSSRLATDSSAVRAAAAAARQVGASEEPFGVGPVSSAAGPASGARVAPVAAALSRDGMRLRLTPDRRLLASPSTRFPVFIDPSGYVLNSTGAKQAYDPVQSDCPSSHYDSSSYPYSPVGYDNYQAGSCQYNDTDYALYRVAIPTAIFGSTAHLLGSSFQIKEVYTSSCSADPSVEVSWIGAISSSTGWPGPGKASGDVDVSKSFGPDSKSCNNTVDTSATVALGYNIDGDLKAISSASNITVRVWEPSDTNDVNHKQLTDNPDLTVYWTDTPNNPSNPRQNGTNSTSGATACSTSASSPVLLGATDSSHGPYLLANYSDGDGDPLQANIKYWNYTAYGSSPASGDYYTANVGSLPDPANNYGWQMPGSFTSGLKDGTVVAWQVQAEDYAASYSGSSYGPYKSSWTSECYFEVTSDPQLPPLQPANFDPTVNQPVQTQLKITISPAPNATVKQYVWAVDTSTPPTSSPPTGQTCTTSSSTTPDCVIGSNGAATLEILVPSPGPHFVSVYEQDTAGNDSAVQEQPFSGAGDPGVSYTSGASLQANFTAALSASMPYDNTMISTASGDSGNANGDGGGDTYDEAQLTSAGWVPGKQVTVDGASFTLPAFGSSSGAPDNLLAANQTLGTGPNGVQGSSLVFLAASTDGFVQVGGLATGSPDSGALSGDVTAPAVMGGAPVTGSFCSTVYASDTNLSDAAAPCVPATGTVNYSGTCPLGSQVSYTLTVPDWIGGPSDIAALITADRNTVTGQQADNPKLYAFAVPIDSSCTVASVTLPDVGASVAPPLTTGANAITAHSQPAVHILGIALRNTTTATPVQPTVASPTVTPCAAGCPSPAGQAWTGAFASPVENALTLPTSSTWGNQTVRISFSPNISAAAGAQVRIRLTNPGFVSEDGSGPLVIGDASIAPAATAPAAAAAPAPLAFGGGSSVTVPEGGDVYSDPLTLPFPVTAGQDVMVSLWIENSALTALPQTNWPSGATSWFSAAGSGDQTTDRTGTPYTGTGSSSFGADFGLTGVDVTTAEVVSGGVEVSPGLPTVVVAGNNVIDAWVSGSDPLADSADAPSQRLAGQLASQGLSSGYGVVDAGIESNQVLADGAATAGGVSLLARIDRDVLAEPDTGTVILNEGLQDLIDQAGSATGATQLTNALALLQQQLTAFGINVITATVTPCYGYNNTTNGHDCTTGTGATVESARDTVNSWINGGGGGPNCAADFDSAVATTETVNGYTTEVLLKTTSQNYDRGDHVNLTGGAAGGYAALATAVFAGPMYCTLAANNYPQPVSSG